MSFGDALAFVLKREGGKVDDPKDRGGRTNKGVTQRVYSAWLAGQGHPTTWDVYDIKDDEVEAIYRSRYWDAIQGDTLCASSPEIALATFDCAVNSGPSRAIKQLQTALGVTADGNFGPASLTAYLLAAQRGYPRILAVMLATREVFLRGIVARDPSQARFLRGWLARVNHVRAACGLPEEEAA